MRNKLLTNVTFKLKEAAVSFLVVLMLVSHTVMVSGAAVTLSDIYLPENQSVIPVASERSGSCGYVKIKCNYVEPPSGSDNYSTIQFRVNCGINMNSWTTIKEGEGYKQVTIKNGYLNIKRVVYRLRGNDPEKDANAGITYNSY